MHRETALQPPARGQNRLRRGDDYCRFPDSQAVPKDSWTGLGKSCRYPRLLATTYPRSAEGQFVEVGRAPDLLKKDVQRCVEVRFAQMRDLRAAKSPPCARRSRRARRAEFPWAPL